MVYYKTKEEIELIRQSCLLVCKALTEVGSILKPGITGLEIDKVAETVIRDHGAVPGFKGYNGFPATLCVSVNEQVVHGIPTDVEFKDGDVISVDCGVYMNDFFGDSAYTFPIGNVDEKVFRLLQTTNTSLYKAIEMAVEGNRIGDIGHAVQYYAERENNYGVVRELVGHGIGRSLHEAPEVPNYGRKGNGPKINEGLVIAIEPMINMGKKNIGHAEDGWTIITKDRLPSAHFEHTVAVGLEKADILSDHSIIETALDNNPNVKAVGVL